MNDRLINEWLSKRGIVLEQGFVEEIRMLARAFKKTIR